MVLASVFHHIVPQLLFGTNYVCDLRQNLGHPKALIGLRHIPQISHVLVDHDLSSEGRLSMRSVFNQRLIQTHTVRHTHTWGLSSATTVF